MPSRAVKLASQNSVHYRLTSCVLTGTLFFYKFRGSIDMELMADLGYNFVGLGNRYVPHPSQLSVNYDNFMFNMFLFSEFDAGISDLVNSIDGTLFFFFFLLFFDFCIWFLVSRASRRPLVRVVFGDIHG